MEGDTSQQSSWVLHVWDLPVLAGSGHGTQDPEENVVQLQGYRSHKEK